jgi:hypothetical protein
MDLREMDCGNVMIGTGSGSYLKVGFGISGSETLDCAAVLLICFKKKQV